MSKSVLFGFFISLSALVAIVSPAEAYCTTYPNILQNTTIANADQVMANFGCAALTSGSTIENLTSVNGQYFTYGADSFLTHDNTLGLSSTNYLYLQGGSSAGLWLANGSNRYDNIVIRGATHQINFYTNGSSTSSLTIAASSGVGVGTLSPRDNFDVQGGPGHYAFFGGQAAGQRSIKIGIDSSGYAAIQGVAWSDGTVRDLSVQMGGGNLGVGMATPGQKLDVAGTIRQSNCKTAGTLSTNASGDIICTSDARLKNVLGVYDHGLSAIMQITPQRYTYKPTATNPVETFVHAGFIAQDVKKAIPQAVALQHSGYYSLDTTAILAASVNAIKELKVANDRQAVEIARLRAQNAAAAGQLKHQAADIQNARSRLAALERRMAVHTAANLAPIRH